MKSQEKITTGRVDFQGSSGVKLPSCLPLNLDLPSIRFGRVPKLVHSNTTLSHDHLHLRLPLFVPSYQEHAKHPERHRPKLAQGLLTAFALFQKRW